ncbi:hypothetical protein RHMOL_Rhmol07G0162600 [Rhododendron molle]|uniref:Uncharacterized protein n=1 Tax=Rhododendron molle TaxID=49168 RepID=A0ACC0N1H1_RHOML|nr:hypothetical protein RHMOL_Rhmol07G0162600 [Rhododendron molle]
MNSLMLMVQGFKHLDFLETWIMSLASEFREGWDSFREAHKLGVDCKLILACEPGLHSACLPSTFLAHQTVLKFGYFHLQRVQLQNITSIVRRNTGENGALARGNPLHAPFFLGSSINLLVFDFLICNPAVQAIDNQSSSFSYRRGNLLQLQLQLQATGLIKIAASGFTLQREGEWETDDEEEEDVEGYKSESSDDDDEIEDEVLGSENDD